MHVIFTMSLCVHMAYIQHLKKRPQHNSTERGMLGMHATALQHALT